LAKFTGNVFPAEFTQKFAGQAKSSNNGWACYKKKVGVEPVLVPRLAGGGSAPDYLLFIKV